MTVFCEVTAKPFHMTLTMLQSATGCQKDLSCQTLKAQGDLSPPDPRLFTSPSQMVGFVDLGHPDDEARPFLKEQLKAEER
jgi:hypothetical protein